MFEVVQEEEEDDERERETGTKGMVSTISFAVEAVIFSESHAT